MNVGAELCYARLVEITLAFGIRSPSRLMYGSPSLFDGSGHQYGLRLK